MPKLTITPHGLLTIFTEIVNGRGSHGSFVQAFAKAVTLADMQNLLIMRSAAEQIIDKYHLEGYLQPVTPPAAEVAPSGDKGGADAA